MPNWAEGTLKIRGSKENIIKFLKEGLVEYPETHIEKNAEGKTEISHKHREVQYSEDDWEASVHCKGGFYIKDTHRAFVEEDSMQFMYEVYEDKWQLEIQKFSQARAVAPEEFAIISKKYDLDIKIFAFERGMEFAQEIEILKGDIIKNTDIRYADYFWEVPFAELGD